MEHRRLPEWIGGYQQPLKLEDACDVIGCVAEGCMVLARRLVAAERQLVAIEFSRWLGVAVGQLLSVAPNPRPELLATPLRAAGFVDSFRSKSASEQLDGIVEVLAALAADPGWGNRNLAFTARQLHGDMQWWKQGSNLWAVLA
ncbi:hypothetical protein [Ferrimicrobium acidiphilum]|uniref:hypothetical protein n=1 Tax=Ferrimicrobium acidiphilum TaxID=121039 RepID=UPI0023F22474|nr:hypothetical protein [Ferrimicrobium acidiphilum]